jgi:hypothetical protein
VAVIIAHGQTYYRKVATDGTVESDVRTFSSDDRQ